MNGPGFHLLGQAVDHLVSLDIWAGGGRPISSKLYHAVRKGSVHPLTSAAAHKLLDVVTPKSSVVITTGFVLPPRVPCGETDGPAGALVVARALVRARSVRVIVVAEKSVQEGILAAARVLGFEPEAPDSPLTIASFPLASEATADDARDFIDRYRPTAVLAIEKIGPNEKGVYHTASGVDMTAATIAADLIIDEARARAIPSFGFGDFGNEIGMGRSRDEILGALPMLRTCKCPCGGGIASRVVTDHLVAGLTSNWAAYGMVACMAARERDASLLHSVAEEAGMIHALKAAGAIDAAGQGQAVDGMSLQGTGAVVQLLHEMLRCADLGKEQ